MEKLKTCPCGKTPTELFICDNGQGGKWGNASGNCCGEWIVEFRTKYHKFDTDECMKQAIRYWNDAERNNGGG